MTFTLGVLFWLEHILVQLSKKRTLKQTCTNVKMDKYTCDKLLALLKFKRFIKNEELLKHIKSATYDAKYDTQLQTSDHKFAQ